MKRYNANTIKAASLSHPGKLIRAELKERGWTQEAFAKIIGRPARTVSMIINGKHGITPELAALIGAAFGTSARLWLGLDAAWRLSNVPDQDSILVKQRVEAHIKVVSREPSNKGQAVKKVSGVKTKSRKAKAAKA